MSGQTARKKNGHENRYYICGTHHNGHKDRCPKRYSVPAEIVEDHILGLIRSDLSKLRDDDKLHEYVVDELRQHNDGHADARGQLQRRLVDLDQQNATLRDHLLEMDPATAQSLGLYDQAKDIAKEREVLEAELAKVKTETPCLPDVDVIRERATAAFDDLETILANSSIEEKRGLIALYVEKIKAEPDTQTVQISLYPLLFSRIIAGTGFEPVTSGL